jgi:hypothetical protein
MNLLQSKKFDYVTEPTGAWFSFTEGQTNYKIFQKKIEALQYATANKQVVGFYFHNAVWDNFDKTTLGKDSLTGLYAERAKQLRDKYDYLVLHYSGGSDSHNILHTFLSNKIKLDEITVRWPKHWIDGKFYTANRKDTSAKNAPSEFNYTIQPTLDYLRQHHPSIKINIVDFTEGLHGFISRENLEKRILTTNLSRNALGSLVQRLNSDTDRLAASTKIENVGHIFGIDKPALFLQDNNLYFYFNDISFEPVRMEADINVEPFYWTNDMPLLPMEQIYQTGMFFKENKQFLHLLNSPGKTHTQFNVEFNLQQNLIKNIVYKHSWDFNKFQVDKPNVDRSDWYSWAHNSPELENLNKIFDTVMRDLTSGIDEKFLISTDKTPLFTARRTKLFHLMSLDT